MLTESQLLTPDVFESPELKRVRLDENPVIPSVVFDSDRERMCFALLFFKCIMLPAGSVRDLCVVDDSSRI
jgi:hypothetical protein